MVPDFLEKFIVADLFKNFTTICRTQMLITGRHDAKETGESRPFILLYLSKIQVDVIVLPMSDLREEQLVVNTVFANNFFFFSPVNQV
jgi:hypothetical protein